MTISFMLIVFVIILIASANEEFCPMKCICRRSNQRNDSPFIKLKCEKVANLEEIDLWNLANEIVHLNLSNNQLETFYPKVQLISLQKLDLSKNSLTELQDGQFSELPNLRRLDLSNNYIKNIELLAFTKLSSLERLKLNQNQISTIAVGTFNPLISLKQLDISNNPLTCDCSLLWLLDWSQTTSVKLVSNPTCNTPPTFKGFLLRKLKIGVDIHCKSPALNNGFPLIEMKPSHNQVVFEGDTLKIQCTAPSISDNFDSPTSSKIEWTWLDSDPKFYFSDITIDDDFMQNTGFIASTLKISRLKRNHTGIWNCFLISMHGNHSKGITIVVISNETEYCPISVTTGNKGTYTWPRTVVNYTATIPCESVNLNYDITMQKASYFCSQHGHWINLNTSMCSYTSETTKILEQFSKVNASIMESAKHFRNYTSNLKNFKDIMDLVFAVETMENYLRLLSLNQIGGLLMEVINNLLNLPKFYLREANSQFLICKKLVNLSETLAGLSSTSLLHKSNLATEIFPIQKIGFSGLKCSWYVDLERNSVERLFYCITNSQIEAAELHGKFIEASITIPETLFHQLDLDEKIYDLLVAMYANSKLFPVKEDKLTLKDVRSAVVGVKLGDLTVTNLTDPIFIMLKSPSTANSIPVWWNPQLNNKTGSWSSEGCHFSHEYHDNIIFYCHQFGYYGLLQTIDNNHNDNDNNNNKIIIGAKFKLSHPAIYIGSFILFTTFLIIIVTYLLYYQTIQMAKKAKHSMINLWIAISCLCFIYVFGIYQTENLEICQIVGMLLHYLTLSSLLWMCVGVNCMYKRLIKNDIIDVIQDDELPASDQPIKKPILGLYFVAWGIPIIICGISAAINIHEYASRNYCFLKIGPPLSALYIPFVILFLFLCIFFLLIRCAIYNLDSNGHLSEGTQATENVDLDLLESNFSNNNQDLRSVITNSTKTSEEIEDPEHGPITQLKAYVIFLFIFIFMWLSCALATIEPFFTPYQNDIFSVIYAIFAIILSVFTIFFYGIARNDVRNQWFKHNNTFLRSRNISDISTNTNVNVINNPDLQQSRSSSRSSKSHNSNIMIKGAVDLNDFNNHENASGTKINNVNLIVLHRQQYRTSVIPNIIENPTNAAEVFYNPHQSIVAKKFFKRQKKHMMKRNNLLTTNRHNNHDSDTNSVKTINNKTSDQSIFGTNSKVNNTNIHVERNVMIGCSKNLNIFSDSGNDYELSNNVPLPKIVLNASSSSSSRRRGDKRKKLIKHVENNMRSVSQQCTLDYNSSENISDSILDKASPDICGSPPPPPPLPPPPLPVHFFNLKSKSGTTRSSSVSVSDLDELYQQIRRGPINPINNKSIVNNFNLTRNSPCFSDSDINSSSFISHQEIDFSENVETTV